MKELSLLEKQTLPVLDCLEYMIDTGNLTALKNTSNKNEKYLVTFGDINFPSTHLGKLENLYNISEFFKKNGVLFNIEFDLINHNPSEFVEGNIYTENEVPLGSIEGKNITNIKKSIISLKEKIMTDSDEPQKELRIILNSNSDTLDIGNISISISKETIERTLLEVLIREGTEVSWDTIMNDHDGIDYKLGDATEEEEKVAIKKLSDTRRRLNKKISTKTLFKKELIKQRKNNYSFTKKVTKK